MDDDMILLNNEEDWITLMQYIEEEELSEIFLSIYLEEQ